MQRMPTLLPDQGVSQERYPIEVQRQIGIAQSGPRLCLSLLMSIHPHSLILLSTETLSLVLAPGRLVVLASLAVVADELEATNHLADGEETQALGGNDAASGELGGAEVADLVEEVLRRLEDGAGLDGAPQVLVVGLEGGQ